MKLPFCPVWLRLLPSLLLQKYGRYKAEDIKLIGFETFRISMQNVFKKYREISRKVVYFWQCFQFNQFSHKENVK